MNWQDIDPQIRKEALRALQCQVSSIVDRIHGGKDGGSWQERLTTGAQVRKAVTLAADILFDHEDDRTPLQLVQRRINRALANTRQKRFWAYSFEGLAPEDELLSIFKELEALKKGQLKASIKPRGSPVHWTGPYAERNNNLPQGVDEQDLLIDVFFDPDPDQH